MVEVRAPVRGAEPCHGTEETADQARDHAATSSAYSCRIFNPARMFFLEAANESRRCDAPSDPNASPGVVIRPRASSARAISVLVFDQSSRGKA